ncbi:MAG: hypothetical protein M1820_001180 [Bogoriella megaspora]|nr:MAG: hypothetical protein M1820_001180 [Bogoriella megaspora]
MDPDHDPGQLRRTSSHTSTSSSRRSNAIRVKPRKYGSSNSLQPPTSTSLQPTSADTDDSLTSFPSLSPSPEVSPSALRQSYSNGGPTSAPRSPTSGVSEELSRRTQSLVGSLVATPSRQPSRAALFDDTPKDGSNDIPGNLHLTEDDRLRQVIAKNGSMKMVRQLAEDLAKRDAQMTALRRRAEERERVLRKMLRECEVSNLDVEKRLRELEKRDAGGKPGKGIGREGMSKNDHDREDGLRSEANMEERTELAMQDGVGQIQGLQQPGETQPDVIDGSGDQDATIRAKQINLSHVHGDESSQTTPVSGVKGTGKGWKGYLWPTAGTSQASSRRSSIHSDVEQEQRVPTRSRASTLTQPRRSVLGEGIFKPPSPGLFRTVSSNAAFSRSNSQPTANGRELTDADSNRSSTSVASWATKLFAGSGQGKNDKLSTRGRSNGTIDKAERSSSRVSINTADSASKAVNAKLLGVRTNTLKGSLAPKGTFRVGSPENKRFSGAIGFGPASPSSVDHADTNLGPVEMDTILPEESRPPTLAQLHYNMSDGGEYLTDRFGFIYDQRRKKRQAEAAAALQKNKRNSGFESIGSARDVLSAAGKDENPFPLETTSPRPDSPNSNHGDVGTKKSKTWQDFLQLAKFPTELLAHTPVAAPITAVDGHDEEEDVPTDITTKNTITSRGSVPMLSTNPQPSAIRIVSGNAEFVAPRTSGSTTPTDQIGNPINQPDPVKSLLQQLTEVHDSLQQNKSVRWNDFLRKVRAERRLEIETASNEGRPQNKAMPEVSLTEGEVIGVAGLGNKGKVGRAKWKEFKNLVLGGIPVAFRAKVWAECSGATAMRIPGYYDDLITRGNDDPIIVNQIQMDITRTLTDNIYFRRGPGVNKLNEVLLAYSRRNPEVGYCQGMNLITACLLLIMPTAEDAFWLLASMIEEILPKGYYDHSLLTSRADQQVLRSYVSTLLPKLSAHLDDLGIELEALSFQWFLSVFTDCLSAEALFRVWDVVLCINDGSTFLFQVALALLKLNEGSLLECETPAGVYHYINHQMTNHAISIDGLIQASEALKKDVRRDDVAERRAVAVQREVDFIRQREQAVEDAMRNRARGKKKVTDVIEEEELRKEEARAVDSGASEDLEVPIRSSRSSSVGLEESEDQYREMTFRQPMPIDEEMEWRG